MKYIVLHYKTYQCNAKNCSVLQSYKAMYATKQEQLVNILISTFLIGGEIGNLREHKENCFPITSISASHSTPIEY